MSNCNCQNGLGGFLDAVDYFSPLAPFRWLDSTGFPAIRSAIANSSFYRSAVGVENSIANAYGRTSISGYAGKLDLAKAAVPPPPAPSLLSDLKGEWTPEKLDTARRSQLEAHWTAFRKDPIIDEPTSFNIEGSSYLWAGLGVIGAIVLLGSRR